MKIHIIILIIISISINVFGQNYFYRPHIVYVGVRDTTYYPKGYSQDSIVITSNPDVDSIFKHYRVKSMIKILKNNTLNNLLDSIFQLRCEGNEYLLWDTLTKYNRINKNS